METSGKVVGLNFSRPELSDPSIGLPNEAPPPLIADPGERTSQPAEDRVRSFPAGFGKVVSAGIARVRGVLPSAQSKRQADAVEESDPIVVRDLEDDADAPLDQDEIAPLHAEAVDDRAAAPQRPFWRNLAFLGTVSAIALGAGAGLYVAGPNHQNGSAKGTGEPKWAGEIGVATPKLLAPAAKLASVPPRESGGPAVVELPPAVAKSALIEEVEGFRSGTRPRLDGKEARAEIRQESARAESPAPPASAASNTPPVPGATTAAALPVPAIAEVGLQTPLPTTKPVATSAAAAAQVNAKAAAPTPIQAASAPVTRDVVAPKKSEDLTGTVQVASAQVGDVAAPAKTVAVAATPAPESEPKRISPAQETELYAMITEISTLVHETRTELAGVLDQEKKSHGAVEARLMDFERRLNLGEAKRALKEAQSVSIAPEAPAGVSVTSPPSPEAKPGKRSLKGLVTASVTPSEEVNTPVVAPPRYRVQAASPGLAMLADMDRTGDDIKPIQVAVGGQVPGFGRVTKISQRGTTWVVQTEKGSIQ